MIDKRKFPRSSGVLLPVSSLHGPFGIGVLGQEAREFIDFLVDSGFHAWQVLPVEHTGMCNSPYKCVSAFAGEPMLIDPRMLLDMGLVTQDELNERMDGSSDLFVEYEIIREKQWKLLWTAFPRFNNTDYINKHPEKYESYRNFNPFWLDEYAIYISLYLRNDFFPWYDWTDSDLRSRNKAAVAKYLEEHREEVDFQKFVQWLFDIQWRRLKEYAAGRGISLIGDMPIYVAESSVEVWSRRELFDAQADGSFAAVGGVPPDYFTPDGQCWGNPVYNWKLMDKENYKWWARRLKATLERYDVVRLDHFRAFDSYWRIPGNSGTAKDGKWVKGPGMALFKALQKELGDLSMTVIAEDLGIIDSNVEELLKQTGLRGMRVLQFGFLGDDLHLPHNYPEESVAYTGTHDNTTLLAWLFALDPEDRRKALFYTGFDGDWYVGGPNCDVVKSFMRSMFVTSASLVVIPIQDLLGYGGDTRINTPGTPTGNWRFRIRNGVLHDIDSGYYRELHKAYQRLDPVTEFAPQSEKEEEDLNGYGAGVK